MTQEELFLGLYDAGFRQPNALHRSVGLLDASFDIHAYAAQLRASGREAVVRGPLRLTEVALGYKGGIRHPDQPYLSVRFPRNGDLANSKVLLLEIGLTVGGRGRIHFTKQVRVRIDQPGWQAALKAATAPLLVEAAEYRKNAVAAHTARDAARFACAQMAKDLGAAEPALFDEHATVIRGEGGLPVGVKLELTVRGTTSSEVQRKIKRLVEGLGVAITRIGQLEL